MAHTIEVIQSFMIYLLFVALAVLFFNHLTLRRQVKKLEAKLKASAGNLADVQLTAERKNFTPKQIVREELSNDEKFSLAPSTQVGHLETADQLVDGIMTRPSPFMVWCKDEFFTKIAAALLILV